MRGDCLAYLLQQHGSPHPCTAFTGEGCDSKCQTEAINDLTT